MAADKKKKSTKEKKFRYISAKVKSKVSNMKNVSVAKNEPNKQKLNYIALSYLAFFALLIIYGIYLLTQQMTFKIDTSNMQNNQPSCVEGETRACSANSCDGIQICKNGAFSSCSWKQICTPTEQVPCVVNGCAVAYKICNLCGTNFSSCKPY